MKQAPHKYRDMTPDRIDEVLSNYLLSSWSYSALGSFSRNEKGFEMSYIYREEFNSSSTNIAGKAYHAALEEYFRCKMEDVEKDLIDLEIVAFEYIENIKHDSWKIQKTTPCIDDCIMKSRETVGKLLINFFGEKSLYEDDIKEILHIELYIDTYLSINGVDIPLPCHGVLDLVYLSVDDKIKMIDHKSKQAYTDEKEIKFSIGRQAITYVNLYESMYGETIDEVRFIENKHSKNKNGSSQMVCFAISIDKDIRALYEDMLYEPLKRMLSAISDPDYVYLMNENDNFIDKAEMYEFWARVRLSDIGDFDIPDDKLDMMEKRHQKIKSSSKSAIDPQVIKKFKKDASTFIQYNMSERTDMTHQQKIEHTLKRLNIDVKVMHIFDGYSSDTYLLSLSAVTNLKRIYKFEMDIALALGVSKVRVMKDLYVHEKTSYLCVESSKERTKDLLYDPKLLVGRKIPIGRDNMGNLITWDKDSNSTPHVVVCGQTGSGKSILFNCTIAYSKLTNPDSIIIFDPKNEFGHLADDVTKVYSDVTEIEIVMEDIVNLMEHLIATKQTNDVDIFFDEYADAIMQCKGLQKTLQRILQKGRSVGIRMMIGLQRASVKLIPGDTKVNLTVQICFRVDKKVSSIVVLDEEGAEHLSGEGDGLIRSPGQGLTRFQGFYKEII